MTTQEQARTKTEKPQKPTKLPTLSGRQVRHLRGLGHHLSPVVQMGKEGLTDGLCGAVTAALADHELIKLRLPAEGDEGRHDLAQRVATLAKAALVQVIGRNVLLYRPREKDDKRPSIALPR